MIQYKYKINKVKGGFKMYDSWIEYIHPKLGCIEVAKIEDEKKLEGYKIIKKIVNGEIVPIEAE